MRLLWVLAPLVMGCASLFASAHPEDDMDMENPAPAFNQSVYHRLFQSGEEPFQKMSKARQKNATEFGERRVPALNENLLSFLEPTDEHASSPLKATKKVITDLEGRSWYVIDRSQSTVVHRATAPLFAQDYGAQPLTIEHTCVVRSYAFEKPSYYGWQVIIRNNAYVGKSMLFELALYPVRKIDAVESDNQ